MYGLYVRNPDADDYVWFTTNVSLEPGAYVLGQREAGSPNVFVADSIPALLLQVGPLIEQAELHAQSSLSPSGTSKDDQRRIAGEMTAGLLQRLTETSSIWVSNPLWVTNLRPVSARSG